MALLSSKELEAMKKKGLFASRSTQKCDDCSKLLMGYEMEHHGKDGRVRCSSCDGKGSSLVNKMEARMKEKAEKASTKVAGTLIPGTAIADLYEYLKDEKVHKLVDAKKVVSSKHKADPMNRIQQLARYGKKGKVACAVTIDTEEGTVQMKITKGGAKPAAPAPAKEKEKEKEKPPAKKGKVTLKKEPKKKKEESEEEPDPSDEATPDEPTDVPEDEETETESSDDEVEASGGESDSKLQAAVLTLVKRTLRTKANQDWTKNKLAEHMKKEHEIDTKRTLEAIKSGLADGKLLQDEGVLALA